MCSLDSKGPTTKRTTQSVSVEKCDTQHTLVVVFSFLLHVKNDLGKGNMYNNKTSVNSGDAGPRELWGGQSLGTPGVWQ